MKQVVTKIAFIAVFLAVAFFLSYYSFTQKNALMKQDYSQMVLRKTMVELTQHLWRIEYGLQYGKELRRYYGMDDILQEIHTSSSYIDGVYIISNDSMLLYQQGMEIPAAMPTVYIRSEDGLFEYSKDNQHFYIKLDINPGQKENSGYFLVAMESSSTDNVIAGYKKESMQQVIVLVLMVGGLLILIIARIGVLKGEKINWLRLLIVLAAAILLLQAVDIGITYVFTQEMYDELLNQSVDKVCEIMQKDINSILASGVKINQIKDVNGWLMKQTSAVPEIHSIYLDEGNRVIAVIENRYIIEKVLHIILAQVKLLGMTVFAFLLMFVLMSYRKKLYLRLDERRMRYAR